MLSGSYSSPNLPAPPGGNVGTHLSQGPSGTPLARLGYRIVTERRRIGRVCLELLSHVFGYASEPAPRSDFRLLPGQHRPLSAPYFPSSITPRTIQESPT